MKPPRIESNYALLDVEKGRHALAKYLAKNGLKRVIITADIIDPFGADDGTSIEFNCSVVKVEFA